MSYDKLKAKSGYEIVDVENKCIYFFIGTEAELIKIFPIMFAIKEKGISIKVIATGQNDISKSNVLKQVHNSKVDIMLSSEAKIKKSAIGLIKWYVKTYFHARNVLKKEQGLRNSILVIHGDTISTVMGAMLGHKLGMRVAHVEAGLRSFDYFNPFPEEFDRVITSRYAKLHFAPNQTAYNNLKKVKGEKFNTQHNSIVDSLVYSESVQTETDMVSKLNGEPYFVFVMHRQENLANREYFVTVVNQIIEIASKMKCVIILHEPTRVRLEQLNLLESLKNDENIITTPRVEYFDFMKLLKKCEFVITDGGSNQEELYYMGKPCLLLRKKTERYEGMGENVVMHKGNAGTITAFSSSYKSYEREPITIAESPSELIAEKLAIRM